MTHKPWFDKFKPISWEGWATYIVLLALAVWDFIRIEAVSTSLGDTLVGFFPQFAIGFLIFALIVRVRRHGQDS